MARSYHLRCWTRFLATLEQVWSLKTDPESLLDEFRPWFSLETEDLGSARRLLRGEGLPGEVDSCLKLLGFVPATRWPLRIEELEQGVRYLDTSENQLFSEWHHEHLFEPANNAVRYIDAVTFTPREGLPDEWVARLTKRLFVHRHRRAARHLPTDDQVIGVAMLRVLVERENR